ncbi:cobalamin biosynthesis protein, partial [Kutzneria sp. 744]|uniref:cobalamin biosynthesis protein n=1 Tax=Kutzneria sp. (strain 744) TaxID=345341 RepID=UPI0004ACAE5F
MIGLFAIDAEQRKLAVELSAMLGRDTVVADGAVHQAVHRMWTKMGAAVLLMPTGAAVRTIAPMLVQDESSPAVVCVTEGFVVVLAGGSSGGANALADRVAEVLGLTMVQSSGSDNTGDTVLEQLVDRLDATVDGDLAECAAAMLDGEPIRLLNPMGFELPPMPDNVGQTNGARWTIVIDDRLGQPVPDGGEMLRIVPRTLVVGLGASKGVSGDEVTSVLSMLEWDFGLDLRAVRAFASIDLKAREEGVLQALEDWNFWHGQGSVGEDPPTLLTYPAEILSTVDVPNPSPVVERETGTASVAEAAALFAAGEMAEGRTVELVVPKAKSENVTVAAARIKPQ